MGRIELHGQVNGEEPAREGLPPPPYRLQPLGAGRSPALDVVEAPAVHRELRILEKGREIVVEEVVRPRHGFRGPQIQARPCDDPRLPQPRERAPEEIRVFLVVARHHLPGPGHDVQLADIVPLRPILEGRDADPRDREGPAHRHAQVVRAKVARDTIALVQ